MRLSGEGGVEGGVDPGQVQTRLERGGTIVGFFWVVRVWDCGEGSCWQRLCDLKLSCRNSWAFFSAFPDVGQKGKVEGEVKGVSSES